MRSRSKRSNILQCHICGIRMGNGRKIAVIGLYSMCDYCFKVTMPKFEEEFDRIKLAPEGVMC